MKSLVPVHICSAASEEILKELLQHERNSSVLCFQVSSGWNLGGSECAGQTEGECGASSLMPHKHWVWSKVSQQGQKNKQIFGWRWPVCVCVCDCVCVWERETQLHAHKVEIKMKLKINRIKTLNPKTQAHINNVNLEWNTCSIIHPSASFYPAVNCHLSSQPLRISLHGLW